MPDSAWDWEWFSSTKTSNFVGVLPPPLCPGLAVVVGPGVVGCVGAGTGVGVVAGLGAATFACPPPQPARTRADSRETAGRSRRIGLLTKTVFLQCVRRTPARGRDVPRSGPRRRRARCEAAV